MSIFRICGYVGRCEQFSAALCRIFTYATAKVIADYLQLTKSYMSAYANIAVFFTCKAQGRAIPGRLRCLIAICAVNIATSFYMQSTGHGFT